MIIVLAPVGCVYKIILSISGVYQKFLSSMETKPRAFVYVADEIFKNGVSPPTNRMSLISRKTESSQKINNTSEECCEIDESSQSESEDELNDSFESDHEFGRDSENGLSSTNDKEHNLNASRGRKRMTLLTESEDDSQESYERQYIEIAFAIICMLKE
uniref:Uncharacterized protein n=1 Tax=Glossina pallidipes TaxID=7398 RepID=A0A1B0AF61_GLOPL